MIAIDQEPFSSALSEAVLPLGRKCWVEHNALKVETCVFERDFVVEPDLETYQRMQDQGRLIIVTMRDHGELKGYVIGFLYRSWHHKNILCGNGDSIYVEPDYRAYTAVMVERFEKELAAAGAQVIGWPVHPSGPVYQLLKARGYVADDVVMEKKLCALS